MLSFGNVPKLWTYIADTDCCGLSAGGAWSGGNRRETDDIGRDMKENESTCLPILSLGYIH